jgi:prepilin-type N-terminal cleavage/methylation domain-containing protein
MKRARSRSGFTLLEVLVVMAVLGIAMVIFAPGLYRFLNRAKLEGTARDTAALLQRARLEAVTRSIQAVVRVTADDEVFAYGDVNGDNVYNPDSALRYGRTDFTLGRFALPRGITLAAPGSQPVIEGLTDVSGLGTVARFNANGSIAAIGAFRFGDERGNFLEVRIEPQASSRVQVRKWDGEEWHTRGGGTEPWRWD